MRISIVIPSFQQRAFLEETLRSVLDQNHGGLELIVVDGGSTDGTTELLKKYESELAWWVSEEDGGQADAINKGLRRVTGEVWSYLNSDDLLAPGCLARIAECFADEKVKWIGAVSTIFDGEGERGRIVPAKPARRKDCLTPWNRPMEHVFPCSNVCFMRREIIERCGLFDESYHYSMDMEYYVRATFAGFEMLRLPDVLGHWRWHESSKTLREGMAFRFLEEELRIAAKYAGKLSSGERSEVLGEMREMRKHLAVRRAVFSGAAGGPFARLRLLGGALLHTPSLAAFRPWLGAVRRAFSPSAGSP